jgi:hypothetical protein
LQYFYCENYCKNATFAALLLCCFAALLLCCFAALLLLLLVALTSFASSKSEMKTGKFLRKLCFDSKPNLVDQEFTKNPVNGQTNSFIYTSPENSTTRVDFDAATATMTDRMKLRNPAALIDPTRHGITIDNDDFP